MASTSEHRYALIIVYMIVLVDMIGYGIILPVLPKLITSITGEEVSDAAVHGGQFMFVYAAAMFVFSPIIGGLSDRFGRRPVLLAALFGLCIDYFIMAIAPSLLIIFIGRLLAGIFGATYGTANAYIADISDSENKARNFGLIASAFGVGFTIGPAIGGFVGEYLGVRAPFYLAAGLCLVNLIAGLWLLPESLPKRDRRSFDWRRANPIGNLVIFRHYKAIIIFALIWFLVQLGHAALPAIWPYFVIEKFGWSEAEIGFSLFVVGISFAFVQAVLTAPILKGLGYFRGAILGLWIFAAAMLAYAFLNEPWMVYAVILVGALGNIYGPAFQAIVTSLVPKDAQGELQGGLSSVASLTLIISPLVMTLVFQRYSGSDAEFYFPGAPFLIACGLIIIAALLFLTQRKIIYSIPTKRLEEVKPASESS